MNVSPMTRGGRLVAAFTAMLSGSIGGRPQCATGTPGHVGLQRNVRNWCVVGAPAPYLVR